MMMNKVVSSALKYSVYVSMAVITVGLIAHFADMGDNILWSGVLLLIVSPIIGMLTATICLVAEKDTKWICVALILIAISVVNILLVKL